MIIDIHYHIWVEGWHSEEFWNFIGRMIAKFMSSRGKEISLEEVKKEIFPELIDPTGEKMIRKMDELGIDKRVILAVDYGLGLGEGKVSIEEQNRVCAEIASRYPDRVIAFAGIDPRRQNAVELLERCAKEWGMKGLKYLCDAGFYPNGEESYRLLRKASELGLVLLTHSAPLPPPMRTKYVLPVHLSDVLVDHPKLQVIVAHAGLCWWAEVANMIAFSDKLAADITMWQAMATQHYETFCQTLRGLLDTAGSDKILFGTDGPLLETMVCNKEWIQLLKDLPQKSPAGINFTEEEVEGILGGNAQKLLGI